MIRVTSFLYFRDLRKHRELRQCLKRSCRALRTDHGVDVCCHVLYVLLNKEFGGKLSCTIDNVVQKASASDTYPIPLQADRLCELAESLSTRTKLLFLRNKEFPERSWIVLDLDTLLIKVNGRVFGPQSLPLHLPPSQTYICLLYTSPSPRDATLSRMPSSA